MMIKKVYFAIAITALTMSACGGNGVSEQTGTEQKIQNVPFKNPNASQSCSESSTATPVAEQPITFNTKGSINPTVYKAEETATISFNGFPKTVAGFQQAQEQLGTTPEGAVLLELFAFEIYNHDHAAGEECIQLANVSNNISCVLRILKDRYNPSMGDYYTPQLVASFLEGATPENAYKANKPFKVTVRTSPTHKYEDVNSLKGTVLNLSVFSNGYDTSWRGVSVVKSKGEKYYKVVNNPSMYTQCKPVSFKIDDEYTDIWNQ